MTDVYMNTCSFTFGFLHSYEEYVLINTLPAVQSYKTGLWISFVDRLMGEMDTAETSELNGYWLWFGRSIMPEVYCIFRTIMHT